MGVKKVKNSFHRIELLLAVAAVAVLFGIFFINVFDFSLVLANTNSNIVTGFVASDTLTENLDIETDQSYVYDLDSDEDFILTSLRLDGSVEGSGIVKIYLQDSDGKRYLVYSNVKKKERGNLITGAAISFAASGAGGILREEIGDDYESVEGGFYNECMDTCFVAISFSEGTKNKFIFELGEDTSLKVDRMSYTIE